MYERNNIRAMAGYMPGRGANGDGVKLNTNENPLPPSDAVMAALQSVRPADLQRYPDPLATRLRQAIATYHECAIGSVIATNGSDELLRLAVTTFVEPGMPIGALSPGYGVYDTLAAIHGCPLVAPEMDRNWQAPANLAATWNDAGARLGLLTNPHAPSGTLLSYDWILLTARRFRGVLLVDEAYVDFVDPALRHDLAREIENTPNLLLCRTLSKGHSLAGLRLGYGIGPAELIAPMLHKARDSYNVDAITQLVATAALNDASHAAASWKMVRAERSRVARALADRGIEAHPSQANFLLARIPPPDDAQRLAEDLAAMAIHIRWFPIPRIADCIRITIGTPDENDRLLAALSVMALRNTA